MVEDDASDLHVILVNGLLAASGFRGLPLAKEGGLQFANATFSISLFAGCIGILENVTGDPALGKINTYTTSLCQTFIVPLVATEVCLSQGVQLEMAVLNLVGPIIHYISKDIIGTDELMPNEYLNMTQFVSVAIMGYFFVLDAHEYGMIMSIVYALSIGSDWKSLMRILGNFLYCLKVLS